MIQLPIPIFYNDEIYTHIEIRKPSGGTIADTSKVIDKNGDFYSGISKFITGCIECVYTEKGVEILERISIKALTPHIPFRSAEYAAIKVMLLYDSEDGIEGVYYCPRCGHQIICEKVEGDVTIDTRDFVSMLPVGYMQDYINKIPIILSEPIEIRSGGQVIEQIESFNMRHPTLSDCIKAFSKYGDKDRIRTQFAIYSEAISEINGEPVDNKWKNAYGMVMFNNMKDAKTDMVNISEKIRQYGYTSTIKKECLKCHKVWEAKINTSNFFVSALHQEF